MAAVLMAGLLGAPAAHADAPAASARLTATIGFGPGSGHIVIARGDGSHRHVLASGDLATIAPSGKRVAVTDWDPGNGGINPRLKVYRSAGGRPLFVLRGDYYPVSWSPDSTKLAASAGTVTQRLVVIDAATGAQTSYATGEFGGTSFSPDSKQLAFVRYGSGNAGGTLEVLDLATGAIRTIRHHANSPVWGSRSIAFGTVVRRHDYPFQNVATIEPDGTGFRRLTHLHAKSSGSTGIYPIDWAADGRRLVAASYDAVSRSYAVDTVHGGARLVARGVEPQALTADGRYVIGQTGNPFCCSAAPVNVVRVPWRGGKRRILLHKAFSATSND